MRRIKYKRYEFHQNEPKKKEEFLHVFLLDIPYLLYYGVIPSRGVINEVLLKGGGDGGLGPGTSWETFEISEEEYKKVVKEWKQMDIEIEFKKGKFRYNPVIFIEDDDVLRHWRHMNYLAASRKKYEELYL